VKVGYRYARRMELAGRNALVTGGAVRVGRAISLALAAEGANVFIHYHRSAAPAEEVRSMIRSLGVQSELGAGDLSHPEAAMGVLDAAREALGPVSVLVNSASAFPEDSLADVTYDGWRTAQDLTLGSAMFMTQAFAAALGDEGSGAVVNVTDVKTRRPYRRHLSYMLAKGGVDTLTMATALDLAPNIRVNAVALGAILPPPGEGEAYLESLARDLPLRRVGGVKVVADAVVFLARNDFITGETIRLDGGAHLV
jgi:NAD(P)-dependent dehydrogenase (short-subunit alcohol dehydrogenase family)